MKVRRNTTPDLWNTKSDLQNSTSDLRNTKSDLRNTTSDLRNTTSDLRNTTSDLRNTTSDLRNTSEDFRNTSEDLRNTSEDLRNTFEDLRNKSPDLRNNLTDLRDTSQNLLNPLHRDDQYRNDRKPPINPFSKVTHKNKHKIRILSKQNYSHDEEPLLRPSHDEEGTYRRRTQRRGKYSIHAKSHETLIAQLSNSTGSVVLPSVSTCSTVGSDSLKDSTFANSVYSTSTPSSVISSTSISTPFVIPSHSLANSVFYVPLDSTSSSLVSSPNSSTPCPVVCLPTNCATVATKPRGSDDGSVGSGVLKRKDLRADLEQASNPTEMLNKQSAGTSSETKSFISTKNMSAQISSLLKSDISHPSSNLQNILQTHTHELLETLSWGDVIINKGSQTAPSSNKLASTDGFETPSSGDLRGVDQYSKPKLAPSTPTEGSAKEDTAKLNMASTVPGEEASKHEIGVAIADNYPSPYDKVPFNHIPAIRTIGVNILSGFRSVYIVQVRIPDSSDNLFKVQTFTFQVKILTFAHKKCECIVVILEFLTQGRESELRACYTGI